MATIDHVTARTSDLGALPALFAESGTFSFVQGTPTICDPDANNIEAVFHDR